MTETLRSFSQGSIRSFVAVPLPSAVQAELAQAAASLARELPGVKWSKKPQNLHVTVKFLGPVEVDRLDAVGAALAGAFAQVPRFAFELRGFGAFPSERHARIVFVGIDDAALKLAAIAETVEAVCGRFGFAREGRAFTAHVTVGRSERRGGVDARAALAPWSERSFGAVQLDEVHVYESQLGGDGSTYVLRSRAPLGAN
jgi:2'-5' RNA ligase